MNTFRLKRNLDEAVYEQILSSIFEGICMWRDPVYPHCFLFLHR